MPAPLTSFRLLQAADLAFADGLRQLAGWNQLPADWNRALALEPEGCFLAETDGHPAGTATVTCHGPDLAWIGMVLVHPAFRRRGIGTALLRHAIRYLLVTRSVPSVKLDATPEGRPLYEGIGFRPEWGLRRWERPAVPSGSIPVLAPEPAVLPDEALRLDRVAFGADRSALLRSLAAGGLGAASGSGGSFALLRDGSRALYLGPVVADDHPSGEAMVRTLLARTPPDRPVFWDIPDHQDAAVSLARSEGFRPVRVLTRMWLGANDSPGTPTRIWGLADPAFG